MDALELMLSPLSFGMDHGVAIIVWEKTSILILLACMSCQIEVVEKHEPIKRQKISRLVFWTKPGQGHFWDNLRATNLAIPRIYVWVEDMPRKKPRYSCELWQASVWIGVDCSGHRFLFVLIYYRGEFSITDKKN